MKVAAPLRANSRSDGSATRVARAALFAVAVGFAVTVSAGSGADTASGRLGGDFPAFYAAGTIVADGGWDSLYSPDTQRAAQAGLFSGSGDDFLYFAYPPYVAALYRPLASLDYRLAYTVHTLAMTAALVGALAILRPVVPLLRRRFELAVTAALLFYPMLRAVTGGQNTALTMLLLAAVWRALADDDERLAGVAMALLLYKPQFALPLIGLMLVGRRWRAAATASVAGAALWGVGVAAMGAGWLTTWWTEVADFAALDADVNGYNAVSWWGFAEGLLGAGNTTAALIGVPLAAATGIVLVAVWARRGAPLDVVMATTILGLVLMSPHAMFYDVGIVVLVAIVACDRIGAAATGPVAVAFGAAWLQLGAEALGFAPLFVILVAGSAWFARRTLPVLAPTRPALAAPPAVRP